MNSFQIQSSGTYHHIILRSNLSNRIFKSDSDYTRFLEILRYNQTKLKYRLLGYGLFSDHIHLILSHSEPHTTSSIIHDLTIAYTKYYQHKYSLTGSIFSKSYLKDIFHCEKELILRIRYIHQKPVKIGLTATCSYPYTSYNEYAQPEQPSFLHRHIIYRTIDQKDDVKASNLFRGIHSDFSTDLGFDVDANIDKKVSIAKKILLEEINRVPLSYEDIIKPSEFRDHLISRIYSESRLRTQEIADLLGISRFIIGRTIKKLNPHPIDNQCIV